MVEMKTGGCFLTSIWDFVGNGSLIGRHCHERGSTSRTRSRFCILMYVCVRTYIHICISLYIDILYNIRLYHRLFYLFFWWSYEKKPRIWVVCLLHLRKFSMCIGNKEIIPVNPNSIACYCCFYYAFMSKRMSVWFSSHVLSTFLPQLFFFSFLSNGRKVIVLFHYLFAHFRSRGGGLLLPADNYSVQSP